METLIDGCFGEAAPALRVGSVRRRLLRSEWRSNNKVSKVENERRIKEGKTDPASACCSSFLCTCTCTVSSH